MPLKLYKLIYRNLKLLMNRLNFHLLCLIYHGDESGLADFLADVQNVNKLRIRALRHGGWRHLNNIERGIVSTTVRVLTRVRSRLLLNTLVKIFMKILSFLLSRFERRLMENLEFLIECLKKASGELRSIYIHRLLTNMEYIFWEAWKQTVAESTGAWTVYGEL